MSNSIHCQDVPVDSCSETFSLFRGSKVLEDVDDHVLAELASHAKFEHYRIPTLLNTANHELIHLRFVIEGQIELVGRNVDGDEACIAVLGPANWVTWLGCFDLRPPQYDFYSSANCKVMAISCKKVREIANANPELYRIAINAISDRFRLLMEWTTDSALLEHEKRIAKLLLLVSRLNNEHDIAHPAIYYTQDRLAVLSRCTRQTLSRSLKLLEQQALIKVGYKRIDIIDLEGLESFTYR
ncbi:Crp/Fnr family transcriptional regulator [Enterovibrio norvegicus]|uniref:Crp/Fnr family transcriptional regulator n=1 Tax=Enterovibrio norvegicus TaxID=188144 RepID=UPI001F52DBB1|nr:Crp/Fnr family transcriptional regulator [Enterovibrio norvegicus]